jgi:NTE family protein
VLSYALDVFRLRQLFDVAVRGREVADDLGFIDLVRRTLLPLPFDPAPPALPVFPPLAVHPRPTLTGRRVGIVATGGSGAQASIVGVARALEEVGVRPAVISLCSGSALFGFPLAAGIPAGDVADFTASLRAHDYVDVNWGRVAGIVPRLGRGFGGIVDGERLEAELARLLGDRTLGDLEIPAYAPIWNVEHNRVEYLGPRSHPDMTTAHAARMAVSLPLFFQPVDLDGLAWCDGGIVDIFPVHPLLDIEPTPDLVIAVNGFYPPRFAGEDQSGWRERPLSILDIAAQVRTCQQAQLARENLARLEHACEVVMLEPVPYETVRGLGFYRQFLDTTSWPAFMHAGREHTLAALDRVRRHRRHAA